MQRLNQEDGAVAVIVALLLVVLVGVGALAVDAGNLYWERRALQNGADAAALAAAQDFASNSAGTAEATARQYAQANNSRGAFVEEFTQPTPNSVRVTTATGAQTGAGTLTAILAGVLGQDEYGTRATATATWGAFGGGATVPLTMSQCEWNVLTGGNLANLPTSERTIYFHSSQTAATQNTCGGPANQNHPGGFGWLNTASGTCSATVYMGQVATDTGNNVPNGCTQTFFQQLIGGDPVLMPVFGNISNAQGNNATYNIVGFAAFEVTGYRFSGSQYNEPAGNVPCSGNDRCIRGRFVAYYDLGAEPSPSATDFGAYVIGLTG
ncbi:pilus assembly protein TadG-related protein [Egicoccus sp. AB-alg6-2]|uniref:pilus assembly protein TadG-related protein n=1 Tax=Egicoccus sp. AB-alg6-2 TaxID=3242692 RepID=UPI00359CCB17